MLDPPDEQGYLVVVAVTGTPRDFDRVEVKRGSQDAITVGLYKDSYFYPSNIAVVRADACEPQGAKCSPQLRDRLLAMRNRAAAARR